MEKIKKHIANLKVAGKLKLYRMTVLVMTFFLVLVALISTLVIRSNIGAHPKRYVHFSLFGRKDKGEKVKTKEAAISAGDSLPAAR